jgi:hypothetical protein
VEEIYKVSLSDQYYKQEIEIMEGTNNIENGGETEERVNLRTQNKQKV